MRRVRFTHLVFTVAVALCLSMLRVSAQSADVATSIDPLLDGSIALGFIPKESLSVAAMLALLS